MATAGADDEVRAVILTGTDPAFCAGVDLKEIGQQASVLRGAASGGTGPWAPVSKPVIAAVNGAAVTGGLELVLNCDIVICSDRAVFADTHARVGVLPGWGLSVLLPLAVGRSRARQMSFTGDFLPADQALTAGLVSEVVPHADLLGRNVEHLADNLRHAGVGALAHVHGAAIERRRAVGRDVDDRHGCGR